jgi:hypothetical protein
MFKKVESCILVYLATRRLAIKMKKSGLALFIGLIFPLSQTASANVINISYTDAGSYKDDGKTNTSSLNHITGLASNVEYRSFFVFDLSAVTDTVVGASLRVFNPSNGYISPDVNETFDVYDVSTSISILTDGTGGTSAFGDLGTGLLYGSATINSTDINTVIDITLNTDALDAINQASGLFALGGTLSSISGGLDQVVFSSTSEPGLTRELQLTTVPVPAAVWLFGSGLIGLIGVARRNSRV